MMDTPLAGSRRNAAVSKALLARTRPCPSNGAVAVVAEGKQ